MHDYPRYCLFVTYIMKKQRYSRNSPDIVRKVPSRSRLSLGQDSAVFNLQSPIKSEIPKTEISNTLTKKHYFVKYMGEGKRSVRKVYFTENLLKLVIEKHEKKLQLLATCEILRIETGFSKSVVRSDCVYGFQVVLDNKVIEMSCSSICLLYTSDAADE